MNWFEIVLALLSFANIWINTSIRVKLLEMKLEIAKSYLTVEDFEKWTNQSNYLPTYKRGRNYGRD
jgi:hypothetical protein